MARQGRSGKRRLILFVTIALLMALTWSFLLRTRLTLPKTTFSSLFLRLILTNIKV